MKKLFALFIIVCLALGIPTQLYAATREQSSVLLIFNNQSGKRYNDKLDAIAEAELNKKINGIYIQIDPSAYRSAFSGRSFETEAPSAMQNLVQDSKADYFVYTELLPYTSKENFDLIYHRKSMTATMVLRIFSLKEAKELFSAKYALANKDDTDHWFVGNPSVAKKALQTVLFKVGQAISVNLPL